MTLDVVAQAAGVSKGGLLYHFPSKESLLGALAQALRREHGALHREREERISSEASPAAI